MSDVLIPRIIARIKESMNEHAHGAMKLRVRDVGHYGEVVGAYRGLEDALAIIEHTLNESEQDETNSEKRS
jgi:hypothetical protein